MTDATGRLIISAMSVEKGPISRLSAPAQQIVDLLNFYLHRQEESQTERNRRIYNDLMWGRMIGVAKEAGEDESVNTVLQVLGIRTLPVAESDLKAFREMQIKFRTDWDAVFTLEVTGRTFPQANWGRTPLARRVYVQGFSEALDRIAEEVGKLRGSGRFFVNANGVSYKDPQGLIRPMIRFAST